jgi:hypothetical protein
MARGDWTTFEEFAKDLGDGVHGSIGGAAIKLGIVNNSTVPSAADATPTWGDYSANEVGTSGNYTTGGIALSSISYTEASGVATFNDSGNISIAQDASGFTSAYWGILYNDDASSDNAIGFVDLGGPVSEQAGAVTITWNASGIFTVTVSS